MASNVRGRTGSRSHGGNFGFGSWGGSGGATGRKTTTKKTTTCASPKYRAVSNAFAGKISSFKTLMSQTKGPARCSRPTPQVLNTFSNWINKGAIVQTCTKAQVAKWANMYNMNFNTRNPTTTACKNVLNKKFGKNTIKAVACTKNGSFMVATSPTCKGKTFTFPK